MIPPIHIVITVLFPGLLICGTISVHFERREVRDYTIKNLALPESNGINGTFGTIFGTTFYPGAGNTKFLVSDTYSLRRVDLRADTVEFLIGQENDPNCTSTVLVATADPGACKLFRKAAIDPINGDIFVVAQQQAVLLRIDGTNGSTSIVAGKYAQHGISGDGVLARDALFNWLHCVAIHPVTRDIYLCDAENHAIRKIDRQTGIMTTVAGTLGHSGFAGDGGPATMAKLHHPPHAEFDPKTNDLLITDNGNHAIRRVDAKTGTISTVAGTPGAWVLTSIEEQQDFTESWRDGELATNAELGPPSGLTVDPFTGDIFISIYAPGHAMRLVSHDTNTITTVAGTPGQAGYSGDGGPARNAMLDGPQPPTADPVTGEIWVPDSMNNVIRVLTPVPT